MKRTYNNYIQFRKPEEKKMICCSSKHKRKPGFAEVAKATKRKKGPSAPTFISRTTHCDVQTELEFLEQNYYLNVFSKIPKSHADAKSPLTPCFGEEDAQRKISSTNNTMALTITETGSGSKQSLGNIDSLHVHAKSSTFRKSVLEQPLSGSEIKPTSSDLMPMNTKANKSLIDLNMNSEVKFNTFIECKTIVFKGNP